MALYSLYRSVEPARPLGDLARGVRAEIADPAWFLARQWQLGEHQGEDASSPVVVEANVAHTKIEYDATRPQLDPTIIPAEALLEAEPDDWWTIGRRYRLGRHARDAHKFPRRRAARPSVATRAGPEPRWWKIEAHAIDIGGFSPDRSHLAPLLFLDVALAHRDDWFSFPVPPPFLPRDDPPPSSGVVVRLAQVKVKDTFDEWWDLRIPPSTDDAPEAWSRPWSLFRTHGLDRSALVVWPTVTAPLASEPLDDIVLGVDEDANLLWAVELEVDGLPLLANAETPDAQRETTPTGTRAF